jgi:hypothetical protein
MKDKNMVTDDDRLHQSRVQAFELLVDRIDKVLERFGQHDSLSQFGDYSIYGDYWGYPQVKVSVHELGLLQPRIVTMLQHVVSGFPGWEIVVAVAVRGHYEDWPDMGLHIRPHEILDGLQRQYFPKEFQGIEYEGSRRGTEHD